MIKQKHINKKKTKKTIKVKGCVMETFTGLIHTLL
jgi:hypothetical protein